MHLPGTGGKVGPDILKLSFFFCPCSSCLPAAFSSWGKYATFYPFFFCLTSFHPNWKKNCTDHFAIFLQSGRGCKEPPSLFAFAWKLAAFLHAETAFILCCFSTVFCTFASTSSANLGGGGSKHHPTVHLFWEGMIFINKIMWHVEEGTGCGSINPTGSTVSQW